MEGNSLNSPLTIRTVKPRKWTVKERRIVLTVLQKHGHQNLPNFTNILPHRTGLETKNFLKKFKTSAKKKLSLKYDGDVRRVLSTIHPWMPFLNNFCNSHPQVHEYLVAFTLPFIEHYVKHPSSTEIQNVSFKWAYRALFNSLLARPFPENVNHETFSMMFASLTQLLDDIRTEKVNYDGVLSNCVNRCLTKKNSKPAKMYFSHPDEVFKFPEVNIFQFTSREMSKICNNK